MEIDWNSKLVMQPCKKSGTIQRDYTFADLYSQAHTNSSKCHGIRSSNPQMNLSNKPIPLPLFGSSCTVTSDLGRMPRTPGSIPSRCGKGSRSWAYFQLHSSSVARSEPRGLCRIRVQRRIKPGAPPCRPPSSYLWSGFRYRPGRR